MHKKSCANYKAYCLYDILGLIYDKVGLKNNQWYNLAKLCKKLITYDASSKGSVMKHTILMRKVVRSVVIFDSLTALPTH